MLYHPSNGMFIIASVNECAHTITAVTQIISVALMMDVLFMHKTKLIGFLIVPVMYDHIKTTLCDTCCCYVRFIMKGTVEEDIIISIIQDEEGGGSEFGKLKISSFVILAHGS